ncbi:MAG TPA: peroxidase-related enzyme [Puia sp.]
MAHIQVPEGVPGIRSLVMFRPETGKPLYELAQILLRGESTLSEAERELIAAHVSKRNDTQFCLMSHAAAARALYGKDKNIVDAVLAEVSGAPISDKLKALLNIAGKVQILGKEVTPRDVEAAREHGATDREIHDTVLIAAAFSMYNRYVDGLASWTPTDPAAYEEMGRRMAEKGYVPPAPVQSVSPTPVQS